MLDPPWCPRSWSMSERMISTLDCLLTPWDPGNHTWMSDIPWFSPIDWIGVGDSSARPSSTETAWRIYWAVCHHGLGEHPQDRCNRAQLACTSRTSNWWLLRALRCSLSWCSKCQFTHIETHLAPPVCRTVESFRSWMNMFAGYWPCPGETPHLLFLGGRVSHNWE